MLQLFSVALASTGVLIYVGGDIVLFCKGIGEWWACEQRLGAPGGIQVVIVTFNLVSAAIQHSLASQELCCR